MIHFDKVKETQKAGKLICNECKKPIHYNGLAWTNGMRGSGWCCTKCCKEFFKKMRDYRKGLIK